MLYTFAVFACLTCLRILQSSINTIFFVLDGHVHSFYAYSEPAQGFYAWESS